MGMLDLVYRSVCSSQSKEVSSISAPKSNLAPLQFYSLLFTKVLPLDIETVPWSLCTSSMIFYCELKVHLIIYTCHVLHCSGLLWIYTEESSRALQLLAWQVLIKHVLISSVNLLSSSPVCVGAIPSHQSEPTRNFLSTLAQLDRGLKSGIPFEETVWIPNQPLVPTNSLGGPSVVTCCWQNSEGEFKSDDGDKINLSTSGHTRDFIEFSSYSTFK